ncbi:MAG: pyruvate carboxylase subunit B [Syntrophales bacterium]|nr:pyruvate carboxylase subunit B [Syntrophales bacterium]MCU0554635.1 pyruvate carboxylase subunit B [Syntrophales bacterium]
MGPVKFQDNTFRDGHQSVFATRMTTEDMIPIAEKMDEVGFWAVEVWGGATFDTMHRFLNEDPWERPRVLKRYMKKTPFAMLLRGQNLVGYRHYADDVVRAFVDRACAIGIDVFRVFDALNDLRNIETGAARIRANGKHFEGAVVYSLTQRHLGGEVFNLPYYVSKARALEEMGADSICIKDMAGILAPYDAYALFTELKKSVGVPLHLHTHYTSGMASMTCLKAIEAGVDIVDTCVAPYAMRTSMPPVEPLLLALEGTERDPAVEMGRLLEIGHYLESLAPRYEKHLASNSLSLIDESVIAHQIPGGMTSNLVSQLKEMNALDRLPDVQREIQAVRREAGMPPLVTPTSQIVGSQAVMNVMAGRYRTISNQFRDLLFGLYGKTPAAVDPKVREIALRGYDQGVWITDRPANHLKPEMEAARRKLGELARTEEDVLTCVLYPASGEQFLKKKYGRE